MAAGKERQRWARRDGGRQGETTSLARFMCASWGTHSRPVASPSMRSGNTCGMVRARRSMHRDVGYMRYTKCPGLGCPPSSWCLHVHPPNSFWLCQMARWLDNAQPRFGYQWQCKIHWIRLNSLMIIGIEQRHHRAHEPATQPQPHALNIAWSEMTHFGW